MPSPHREAAPLRSGQWGEPSRSRRRRQQDNGADGLLSLRSPNATAGALQVRGPSVAPRYSKTRRTVVARPLTDVIRRSLGGEFTLSENSASTRVRVSGCAEMYREDHPWARRIPCARMTRRLLNRDSRRGDEMSVYQAQRVHAFSLSQLATRSFDYLPRAGATTAE